ncbi:hypothetical protein [Pedobacter sp.]|uniref:hypothetical protein n=1 Tax=Pedobacter sp. TaxID=1411316 RepID=UPI003C63BA5E
MNRKTFIGSLLSAVGLTLKAKEIAASDKLTGGLIGSGNVTISVHPRLIDIYPNPWITSDEEAAEYIKRRMADFKEFELWGRQKIDKPAQDLRIEVDKHNRCYLRWKDERGWKHSMGINLDSKYLYANIYDKGATMPGITEKQMRMIEIDKPVRDNVVDSIMNKS